jgi:hypothetical protein
MALEGRPEPVKTPVVEGFEQDTLRIANRQRDDPNVLPCGLELELPDCAWDAHRGTKRPSALTALNQLENLDARRCLNPHFALVRNCRARQTRVDGTSGETPYTVA